VYVVFTWIQTSIVDIVDQLLQRLDVVDGAAQGRHLRALVGRRRQQLLLDRRARSLKRKQQQL
jgi:hypothetical protein